jgi:hypothetical protein
MRACKGLMIGTRDKAPQPMLRRSPFKPGTSLHCGTEEKDDCDPHLHGPPFWLLADCTLVRVWRAVHDIKRRPQISQGIWSDRRGEADLDNEFEFRQNVLC